MSIKKNVSLFGSNVATTVWSCKTIIHWPFLEFSSNVCITSLTNCLFFHRLFERGLAYVGSDFRSNTLWDEYIKYEESLQAWSHLAVIYTRILEHPVQQLDRYFNWWVHWHCLYILVFKYVFRLSPFSVHYHYYSKCY
jgi:hypothetical protein